MISNTKEINKIINNQSKYVDEEELFTQKECLFSIEKRMKE